MKKIKSIALSSVVLIVIIIASGNSKNTTIFHKDEVSPQLGNKQNQMINMFVTHGHCSTPFAGIVEEVNVSIPLLEDLGNPFEEMKISFEVDPQSFYVSAGEDLTARIKTPGLFIGGRSEKIIFRSTQVYTMGLDWYQVNGKMSIKGVERDVKLFVTGIRDSAVSETRSIVIEGQMNLFDWGIDYDKIVNGKSEDIATKLMHLNMKIELAS